MRQGSEIREQGSGFDLATVQAGDRVWIEYRRAGQKLRRHDRVIRVTRTQILIGSSDCRFHRIGGAQIGGLGDRIVGVATTEEIDAFELDQGRQVVLEAKAEREEKSLRRLFEEGDSITLVRRGGLYDLGCFGITAKRVRSLLAGLKRGERR